MIPVTRQPYQITRYYIVSRMEKVHVGREVQEIVECRRHDRKVSS
jgi:hypothetical protein